MNKKFLFLVLILRLFDIFGSSYESKIKEHPYITLATGAGLTYGIYKFYNFFNKKPKIDNIYSNKKNIINEINPLSFKSILIHKSLLIDKSFEIEDHIDILKNKVNEIKFNNKNNLFEFNKEMKSSLIHEMGHAFLSFILYQKYIKYIKINKINEIKNKINEIYDELNENHNKFMKIIEIYENSEIDFSSVIKIKQINSSSNIISSICSFFKFSNCLNDYLLIRYFLNNAGIISERVYCGNKFNYRYKNEKGNDLNDSWNNLNEIFNGINKKRKEESKKELNYIEKRIITDFLIRQNINLVESEKFKNFIYYNLNYIQGVYKIGIKNIEKFQKKENYEEGYKEDYVNIFMFMDLNFIKLTKEYFYNKNLDKDSDSNKVNDFYINLEVEYKYLEKNHDYYSGIRLYEEFVDDVDKNKNLSYFGIKL